MTGSRALSLARVRDARRPDRRRSRPRPLRHRAARRHAPHHPRHAARLRRGVTLDILLLAIRLVSTSSSTTTTRSRCAVHASRSSSPGVERSLRTPGALPARGRQARGHPPQPTSSPPTAASRASSSPPTTHGVTVVDGSTDRDRSVALRPDRPCPHRVRVGAAKPDRARTEAAHRSQRQHAADDGRAKHRREKERP